MKQDGRRKEHPEEIRELEEVVRAAGSRADPPVEDLESIREAARAEWRRVTAAARVDPRPESAPSSVAEAARMRWLPLAAGLAVAVLAGWWMLSRTADPMLPGPRIASIERAEGSVRSAGNALAVGGALEAGALVETLADSGVALRVADRSIRLAENSALRLTSAREIELLRGAVYVDSPFAATLGLEVVTEYGRVREIGTQFEVRVRPASGETDGRAGEETHEATGEGGGEASAEDRLAVRVREGRVVLKSPKVDCSDRPSGRCEAAASEEMVVDSIGGLRFQSVPVYGEAWADYIALAPLPGTDNALEVVTWAARETGLALDWSSDEVRSYVGAQRYSGIEQTPDLVLENALRSIGVAFDRADGSLVVTR